MILSARQTMDLYGHSTYKKTLTITPMESFTLDRQEKVIYIHLNLTVVFNIR